MIARQDDQSHYVRDDAAFEKTIREAVRAAFQAPHLLGIEDDLGEDERAQVIAQLRELRTVLREMLASVDPSSA